MLRMRARIRSVYERGGGLICHWRGVFCVFFVWVGQECVLLLFSRVVDQSYNQIYAR